MWHMNKNNSGPYIGRDRLYGGIQVTEPRLLLGPAGILQYEIRGPPHPQFPTRYIMWGDKRT